MPGNDAMGETPCLKHKTNNSTEQGSSPSAIYPVAWRLIDLSDWMEETSLFSINALAEEA